MPPETLESLLATKNALESVGDRFETALIVFGVLVFVGVGGESVYGFRAWRNNRKLSYVQESIDHLRQADVARTVETAELLRKENLVLQSDVLKLRTRTEYRHLTPDQQRTISNKMKEFSETDFALAVYQSENDAAALLEEIKLSLEGPNGAGWKLRGRAGIGSGAPETDVGVLIKVRPDATVTTLHIANKLAEALRHENLFVPPVGQTTADANPSLSPFLANPKESPIVVIIARRP